MARSPHLATACLAAALLWAPYGAVQALEDRLDRELDGLE